tara:strand:+ start:244 stop:504 length:261 start_codon:yes stop_codon:yes gene_type:complete
MRDNFRPNLRLTTNILLVIGTFLIAFKIDSLNHHTRIYQQRKNDCARAYALNLTEFDEGFLKKYKLEKTRRSVDEVISYFCNYYLQ